MSKTFPHPDVGAGRLSDRRVEARPRESDPQGPLDLLRDPVLERADHSLEARLAAQQVSG